MFFYIVKKEKEEIGTRFYIAVDNVQLARTHHFWSIFSRRVINPMRLPPPLTLQNLQWLSICGPFQLRCDVIVFVWVGRLTSEAPNVSFAAGLCPGPQQKLWDLRGGRGKGAVGGTASSLWRERGGTWKESTSMSHVWSLPPRQLYSRGCSRQAIHSLQLQPHILVVSTITDL